MALAKIQKIQLIGSREYKDKILGILQDFGALEIKDMSQEESLEGISEKLLHEIQKTELEYANTEFSIKLLSEYGEKKGLLAQPITLSTEEVITRAENFNYKEINEKCNDLEEKLSKAENEINAMESEITALKNWEKFPIDLKDLSGTEQTMIKVGTIKSDVYNEMYQQLDAISPLISIETINKNELNHYIVAIFAKELEKEIRQTLSEFKFQEVELPQAEGLLRNHFKKLQEKIKKNQEIVNDTKESLTDLAKNLDDLKITHDYLEWQKEKLEEQRKLGNTDYSFVVSGWIDKELIPQIENKINKMTEEFIITNLDPEEDEKPPVIIKNNKFMQPFEAVTGIYGLPLHTEIDPTPFLAAYFIIFFGMCLTDAGYGLIMFIVMALALKYLKLQDGIKKLVKLLMYGGIVTFVIGAIFGGWFGLTVDQVPEFLTYTNADGEKLFVLQRLNSLTDPLTVLIIALALGYLQILMGTYMKLIHGIRQGNKKDAILDTGTWAFMLTGIAFAILVASKVLPEYLMPVGTWWVILAAVILILTQGRDKKSILGKAFSGILSLYNLIGYLSDVLSYSRLLALGLATAIIGLAVNIIAALLIDMIPYAGYVIGAMVFVIGHVANLVINALGSFIHSGRLQFVEFFGQFLEGGGDALKPFSKKSKYVFIKNN